MEQRHPPDGHKLTDEQWATLRALADAVVPPSTEHGVPGAGDEAICKNVINDAARRLPLLIEALAALNSVAQETDGTMFVALDETRRERVADAFRDAHPGAANLVQLLVTQCYYRDDRVLHSLGMEARPPFPVGYDVDEGDWSVLDDVRKRPPFHRPLE